MMRFLFFLCALVSTSLIASSDHMTSIANAPNNGLFLAKTALFSALLLGLCLIVARGISRYARLPEVASYIIAGALVGPAGLQITRWNLFAVPSVAGSSALELIIFFFSLVSSFFCVPLLMWMAGHETDIAQIKNVSLIAITAGLLGALFPLIMMAGGLPLLGYSFNQATALGLVFAATSVSLPVALFAARNTLHTRPAQATLGAAVVDDVAAVLALSCFTALCTQSLSEHGSVGLVLVRMILAVSSMLAVGHWILPRLYRFTAGNSKLLILCGFVFVWCMSAWAELLGGLAGITGAYFAGYFHKQNDANHTMLSAIEPLVTAVLMPLYLCMVGLSITVPPLTFSTIGLLICITLLAIISKVAAGACAVLLHNRTSDNPWTFQEAALFSVSLIPRGEVGLVIAGVMTSIGFISPELHALCVVGVVITTIISPTLMQVLYNHESISSDRQSPTEVTYTPVCQVIEPSSLAEAPEYLGKRQDAPVEKGKAPEPGE